MTRSSAARRRALGRQRRVGGQEAGVPAASVDFGATAS